MSSPSRFRLVSGGLWPAFVCAAAIALLPHVADVHGVTVGAASSRPISSSPHEATVVSGSSGPVAAAPDDGHAPPTPALDAEAEAWVDRTLASLTLRQRVAQLVVPWVPGQRSSTGSAEFQRMLQWVEKDEVGGLIISRGPPDAIAARLNAAQARSRVPLLVMSDLESGPSMRLSPGGTNFPPGMAFAAAGDELLAREAGRITATEARAVGIHLTLGPILDVNSNPLNPIINVRSFGEDPELVGRLATAWASGARERGLLAAGKHFPGHGETSLDSHVRLPTLLLDSARLEAVELAPFRSAIVGGIDALLVGHIAVTAFDGPGAPPATLSRRIMEDLLRTRLGFDGLIITDAMNMGAITRTYSVPEASILAVQAGADVLLQPPGASQVIDAIVQAVHSGRIPPERIDRAARRVLAAKAAAGLHLGSPGSRVDPSRIGGQVGARQHTEVAEQVAAAAITLVRDERDLVPLRPTGRRILHLTYTGPGAATLGTPMSAVLRERGFVVDQQRVAERVSAQEIARLRERAGTADLIVATAFVAPRENRPLAVGSAFSRLVEELAAAGRPVVAVSLGSPYILESFPSVPAYLLAWSSSEASQRAAARALVGDAPIRGRLPVSLAPRHHVGEGLDR